MKSLFLNGYGLSIKVKNTRMVFTQGIDPFSDKRETLELPATACDYLYENTPLKQKLLQSYLQNATSLAPHCYFK